MKDEITATGRFSASFEEAIDLVIRTATLAENGPGFSVADLLAM